MDESSTTSSDEGARAAGFEAALAAIKAAWGRPGQDTAGGRGTKRYGLSEIVTELHRVTDDDARTD